MMAKDDPFPKDVFPAELTEIYRRRRRQKAPPERPIESIQASVEELDKAEKEVHEAEKRVRDARETNYIPSWIRRFWRVQAIEEAEELAAQCRVQLKKKQ
jgi:exonuclease VII small subunit